MALADEAIVEKGEGCPTRVKYRVSQADLQAIEKTLNEVDGDNPWVAYESDVVRRALAGGSKSSVGCIVWNLNKVIAADEDLSKFGIYAHVRKGTTVRFDKIPPSGTEAEQPS